MDIADIDADDGGDNAQPEKAAEPILRLNLKGREKLDDLVDRMQDQSRMMREAMGAARPSYDRIDEAIRLASASDSLSEVARHITDPLGTRSAVESLTSVLPDRSPYSASATAERLAHMTSARDYLSQYERAEPLLPPIPEVRAFNPMEATNDRLDEQIAHTARLQADMGRLVAHSLQQAKDARSTNRWLISLGAVAAVGVLLGLGIDLYDRLAPTEGGYIESTVKPLPQMGAAATPPQPLAERQTPAVIPPQ